MKNLENILKRIDGRGYKAYNDIKGRYDFKDYILNVVKVQGDPFASPSLFSCEIDLDRYGYDNSTKTFQRKLLLKIMC